MSAPDIAEKAKKDLRQLLENNFAQGPSYAAKITQYKSAQSPGIIVVSCCDSRVPDSCIGIGEPNHAFSIKSIGNQIETTKGSVAYGLSHLTPYLLIVGHTGCGAIKGASGDFSGENEHIQHDLSGLVSVIEQTQKKISSSATDDFKYASFAQGNVDHQVGMARQLFSHIKGLTVVGGMFDFHNVYGTMSGQLYIVNVNGNTDANQIMKHPFLDSLPEHMKKERVKRI